MEFVNDASEAPQPVGAYSQAVSSSGMLFCSGQIGLDPETGELVQGGIEAQTERVLKNISGVLQAAGATRRDIVMTTIFLTELEYASVVNEIYGKFIGNRPAPARQTIVVKALPLAALVEISVIALGNS